MSDGDALLAAVPDNPADDTPRLVYADWLQEHGREDRAEFIRSQVRRPEVVYRYGTGPGESGSDERVMFERVSTVWAELTWAEGEGLYYDLAQKWSGISRGWLSHLFLPMDPWNALDRRLLTRFPVQEIHFPNFRVEIDPPGEGHGWQLYYYEPGEQDYFNFSGGLETRAEMIDRLMVGVRALQTALT